MRHHLFLLAQTIVGLSLTMFQSQAQSIYEPSTFSTLAGYSEHGSADFTGSAARFNKPQGLAVDRGAMSMSRTRGNNTIRKGYSALAISSFGPHLGFATAQFGFDLTGSAGKVAVIEGSTDLVNWLPLWTNTLAGPLS
jgi:hypothetical protein